MSGAVEATLAAAQELHERRLAERIAEHVGRLITEKIFGAQPSPTGQADAASQRALVAFASLPSPAQTAALRRVVEHDTTHAPDDAAIVRECLPCLESLAALRRQARDGET